MSNIEEFYERTKKFTDDNKEDLSPESLTVVLFRVALEKGAESMGMPLVCYLISRLMAVTLGVLAGDPAARYEDILEDFEDDTKH
jgi:hypothetical protein